MPNDMRDRLADLVQDAVGGCARHWAEIIADHLIENGVILPPCKVGDTVYTKGHGNAKHPKEWTVVGVWFSAEERYNHLHIHWYKDKDNFATRQVDFSEIGKTVFLTKEEAERALEGRAAE